MDAMAFKSNILCRILLAILWKLRAFPRLASAFILKVARLAARLWSSLLHADRRSSDMKHSNGSSSMPLSETSGTSDTSSSPRAAEPPVCCSAILPTYLPVSVPLPSPVVTPTASRISLPQIFFPIMPSESDRYEHGIIIPKLSTLKEIPPITTKFEVLYGWTRHVHPEGQPYYVKTLQGRTYLTDAEITKPDNQEIIQRLMGEMEKQISKHQGDLPNQFQVYLEPLFSGTQAAYYMVNEGSDQHCLFWLDRLNLCDHIRQDIGLHSLSHWQLEMLHEYWTHCEHYPHCVSLTEAVFKELPGILMHLIVDLTTTGKTTGPFTLDDLRQWFSMIDAMKLLNESDHAKPYVVTAIARLMWLIMRSRFMNFYGQHGARLDSDQTVPGEKMTRRSLLIRVLSPLLFFAPDRHLERLRLINPSEFVYIHSWSQFIVTWEKPWNNYILYATVLLAVNVSFLAILDVSPAVDRVTTGQVASLCSTVTSIGSIVIGLLLVNEDQSNPKDAYTSYDYFENLRSAKFEYEPLAILYSLPYALLMWSMLTFVVAVAFLCFQTNDVQLGITAVVVVIVLSLVTWEIVVHWKSSRSTGDYNLFYIKETLSHCKDWLASLTI